MGMGTAGNNQPQMGMQGKGQGQGQGQGPQMGMQYNQPQMPMQGKGQGQGQGQGPQMGMQYNQPQMPMQGQGQGPQMPAYETMPRPQVMPPAFYDRMNKSSQGGMYSQMPMQYNQPQMPMQDQNIFRQYEMSQMPMQGQGQGPQMPKQYNQPQMPMQYNQQMQNLSFDPRMAQATAVTEAMSQAKSREDQNRILQQYGVTLQEAQGMSDKLAKTQRELGRMSQQPQMRIPGQQPQMPIQGKGQGLQTRPMKYAQPITSRQMR